jgi:hypothetical protein
MTSKEAVHRELDQLTSDDRAEHRELYQGRNIDERVASKLEQSARMRARAVYGVIENPEFDRRRFLQTLGASALLAPFLGSRALKLGTAKAQSQVSEGEADNLLLIDWPCGMEPGWTPMGTGADYMLTDVGPTGQSDSNWGKEPQMKTLVDKHRDKILILSGWSNTVVIANNLISHSQGPCSMWTNWTQGAATRGFSAIPSIEQHIGEKLKGGRPLKTLHTGVLSLFREAPESTIANPWYHWAAPQTPADAENDPGKVYMQIMPYLAAAAPTDSGGTAPAPAMVDAVKNKKKSVLDYLMGELSGARNKVSREDVARLDEHLTAVRDLESRLFSGGAVVVTGGDGTAAGAACNMVTAPALTGEAATRTPANGAATAVAHAQLIAMAFKCGVTKVATLQLGESDCMFTIPYEGATSLMHRASHNMGNGNDAQTRWVSTRWMMDRLADIIEVFATTDIGGGKTLLDNTLIVATTEMGLHEHPVTNVNMIVAGGSNGPFQFIKGQHLDMTADRRTSKMNYTLEKYFDVDAQLSDPSAIGGDCMGTLEGIITV